MHFQNLGIYQKTKTLDTFKLAIGYDIAVTTLCQSLVSPGFYLKPKAEKTETYCQLPTRFLPESDRLVVQSNDGK